MKRVRVTSRDGQPKRLAFFDSSEALYLWCNAPDERYKGATVVVLQNADFIDVEWVGCEFVHEGNEHYRCLTVVRAAHAQATDNDSGFVVTPIIGWIVKDILNIRSGSNDLAVRELEDDEGIALSNEVKI